PADGDTASCGSHATIASAAVTAQTPSATEVEPPAACMIAKVRPAAADEPTAIATVYVAIIVPIRSGNRRLTRLGSSTLSTAIESPARIVPGKSAQAGQAARRTSPVRRVATVRKMARSSPRRARSAGPAGAPRLKQRTGTATRADAAAGLRPRSA